MNGTKLGFSAGALAVTLVTLIILVPFGGQAANEVLVSVVGTATPVPPTPTPAPVTEDGNWTVLASADDAYENDAGVGFNSSGNDIWIESGGTAAGRINSAMRMRNVDIPQGATINTATASIFSNQSGRFSVTGIFAHDVDDSPSLSDVTTLPRTTASSFWDSGNVGVARITTSSITAVIQEIVDRPGWVSGNNLTLIFIGNDGSNYNGLGYSLDAGGGEYTELDVNFTYTP